MESPSYRIRSAPPQEVVEELSPYDRLTSSLLFYRGVVTKKEAERFFEKDYVSGLHDPFLLPDMEVAVARILAALDREETIGIFSDYDCDGIPGGVLMHDFFVLIGYTKFINYIPHRHEEGYGLNVRAIKKLKEQGVSLLVTVDCGITDVEEVAHARTLGMDVIVTDHHEPGIELPPACAVVNPKRTDSQYPFSGLCGTGVAFKLISALLMRRDFHLDRGKEKWLLDMVGIATVADMVPLRDENRILAHYGLLVLKKNKRTGLQHLFRTMRMDPRTLSEDDIGFMIAPRINAASRMDTPEDAFKLLTARTSEEGEMYARHLDRINNERKGVVGAMVRDVHKKLSLLERMYDVLVIGDPLWRPSLVGLAANTLVETYARPVFVWGRDGNGLIKGSCRSNGIVSVVALMEKTREAFLEFGGHHMSGGFSIREDYVHTLDVRLEGAYQALVGEKEVSKGAVYDIDAELALEDVTEHLVLLLNRFAPFGEGNQKPLFLFRGIVPEHVVRFGKTKEHIKSLYRSASQVRSAIGFFMAEDSCAHNLHPGKPADLVAHIEESFFGGKREIRLRIVDVLPSSL